MKISQKSRLKKKGSVCMFVFAHQIINMKNKKHKRGFESKFVIIRYGTVPQTRTEIAH